MYRFIKQLIIGSVYIVLLSGMGYGFYYWRQSKPTCFDKIQNQNEEGVDCGLVCGNSCRKISAIEIYSASLFKVDEGDYDILAEVHNPNSDLGSSKVDYDVIFMDTGGAEVDRRSLTFYILPGQTKHIILNSIKIKAEAFKVKLVIKNVAWEKLSLFDPQLISFPIRDKQFKDTDFGAIIRNESDFDFDTVDIGIILYDKDNKVIGVNRSNVNTLLSRTERYFKVVWPASIQNVFRIDVEPSTNILDNLNFIKSYGTEEKFQEYYPN